MTKLADGARATQQLCQQQLLSLPALLSTLAAALLLNVMQCF